MAEGAGGGDRRGLNGWSLVGEAAHADCKVFHVYRERFRQDGARGREGEFYVCRTRPFALVLGLTPERELVLVRQFRFGSRDFSLEVPGGLVDAGESPLEAAVRELREETGYEGRSPREIGRVRSNPAILNNWCHFVLIEEAVGSGALQWDENEEMEILTAPVGQVLAWAREGAITHALAVGALFYLEGELRERGRLG
ncbi:MAG: NUDIX hydrolase [Puniceicoccaceae bacterium]|nr:MAG: NUDIX hydrolase [Puniceicoccaceae bacterium]